ncbi:MAG: hypothetical protein RMN25_14020 [Anaerolineae bacterium]|nr:hypothetical protein [Thermoflexales bacterium]MDW8408888.1 hypothetical protein [Anaerolineae bacterium]
MSEELRLVDDSSAGSARPVQPDPVRVTDYRVMPWPDGTRVTVELGLTPFREFPAMDISIVAQDGQILRTVSVVGAIERRPAPTLHLPRLQPGTPLLAVIEMLWEGTVAQTIEAPFEVAGPIVKRVIEP